MNNQHSSLSQHSNNKIGDFVNKFKLPLSKLSAKQVTSTLGFSSTDDLKNYNGILGQERAITAIQFGIAMQRCGYNIFVMGESGTGRMSYLREHLKSESENSSSPTDWAYINNFDNPKEPYALELPTGKCHLLQKDFELFIDQLLMTFPAAFENPTYQHQKNVIERAFNKRYDGTIDKIEQEALRRDVALYRDTGSLTFTPIQDGQAMNETEFAQLPARKREKFNKNIRTLETLLNKSLVELPQWKRESNESLDKLNQKTIDQALEPLLNPLLKKYSEFKKVTTYLAAVKQHLHRTVIEILADDRNVEHQDDASKRAALIELYAPNVIVEHSPKQKTPIIYESHPSYKNLFGRIEYSSEMGALVTNYRQICAGSLHKANGGYLLLDASKLLEETLVWDALKRALKEKQVKIESPYSEMGIINTTTLSPEVIPLNIKVILVGSRHIYYLLQQLDNDFHEIFRVLVDFDDQIPRNDTTIRIFSRILKSRANQENYPALTASAVVRLIEYSSRLAGDQQQLSSQIGNIFDLLAEADFIRRITNGRKINQTHIDGALDAKSDRTGRVNQQILQEMLEGSVLIDTDGTQTGKINGLTVLSVGDCNFGSPARITATVYPGSQGIVDVEREVALGQAIHSKGIMILSGYMGSTYAQTFPLTISASLAIEQSYGYIDGDSASVAELCCLISALTDIPIKQCFAVTGSMNQHGEVQPVGGINEKIEGFFDLCQARGLDGNHGVIIPATNIRNLMLHQRVLDAVKSKQFSIFAVSHVQEALELLTGKKHGTPRKNGNFGKNTINYAITKRLKALSLLSKDQA